jgi:ABC-type uncharacterized transport system substrate-binding protein
MVVLSNRGEMTMQDPEDVSITPLRRLAWNKGKLIGDSFVASIPHPGGNVTGFITMPSTMASKWLEMLKEIAPRVKRVAFLFNPATAPYFEYYLNPLKAAAPSFAVEAIAAPVHDTSSLESVISCTGARAERWPDCDAG